VTPGFSEDEVEVAALGWLRDLGYEMRLGPEVAPDGPAPERQSYGEVILPGRFRAALQALNPQLPAEVLDEV